MYIYIYTYIQYIHAYICTVVSNMYMHIHISIEYSFGIPYMVHCSGFLATESVYRFIATDPQKSTLEGPRAEVDPLSGSGAWALRLLLLAVSH